MTLRYTSRLRRRRRGLAATDSSSAGSSLDRVLRVGVYLTDLGHFQAMNRIFAEYLDRHRPARSTVGVAALPMGALVEMDMIALCD